MPRPRRRPLALTARGWGFVAAGVGFLVVAYAVGSVHVQLAGALALAFVVVALITARWRRPRLGVGRAFSAPLVAAGGSTTVTVTVTNLSMRALAAARWSDALPWGDTAEGRWASLPARAGTRPRTLELRYRVSPPTRGIVEIGPLRVDVDDPFGLVHGSLTTGETHRLVVTPAVVSLHDAGFGFAAGEGVARLIQRSTVGNDDDLMTREYRRGDAMRRIHWRVSARQGELMVRQEEQRARPELRLVVDTRRAAYRDARDSERLGAPAESETFEWVVRMVASLGMHLRGAGFELHVVETAAPQVADAQAGDARAEEFLASLATIRLANDREPLRAPETGTAGGVFAVLAEPDAEVLEWLVRMRRPGEAGIAFLPAWSATARSALADAGWQCVLFRPDDDLATVWSAVTAMEARA